MGWKGKTLLMLHVIVFACPLTEAGGQQAFAPSWNPQPTDRRCGLCALRARRRGIAPRGVLGRVANNKLVSEVEREEAEDLRREALENAGQAAIDKLDGPVTQGATRFVSEMFNRIDDNILAAANKGATLAEKGLPSLQGATAKLQAMDLSNVLAAGSGKHVDLASGLFANLANVLSQDQVSMLLVDAPLQFSQFAAPLIAGGGWEFAFAAMR